MRKSNKTERRNRRRRPAKLVLSDAPDNWRRWSSRSRNWKTSSSECGAAHDQDADHGRAHLRSLLFNKRRQLRGIDVAVQAPD